MDQPDDRTDPDLLSALEVIEGQPLATRAEAYEHLHDTLARRLESAPGSVAATGPGSSPAAASPRIGSVPGAPIPGSAQR